MTTPLAKHYAIAIRCELAQVPRGLKKLLKAERLEMVAERNAGVPLDEIARAHRVTSNTLAAAFQWARNNGHHVAQFRKGTGVLEGEAESP